MNNRQATLAVYNGHDQVNEAIAKLRRAGYSMEQLSIIGRDYHTRKNVAGYYSTDDQMNFWGGLSAFWDGLWILLKGSGFFILPGFGPLLFAGPFVASLVTVLKGDDVAGESDVLGVALVGLGIPNEYVIDYQTEIKRGNLVLIAQGTAEEVAEAKTILITQTETILAGKAKSYACYMAE